MKKFRLDQRKNCAVLILAISAICPAMLAAQSADAAVDNATEAITAESVFNISSASGIFNGNSGTVLATYTSPVGDVVKTSGYITGGVDPVLSVNATLSPGTNLTGTPEWQYMTSSGVVASLTYYFRITGPAGSVPIIIRANGSVNALSSTTNEWVAEIGINVFNNGSLVSEFVDTAGYGDRSNSDFSMSQPIVVDTTDLIGGAVTMFAEAGADIGSPYNTATAIIDPTISIDPSFPNANEYSVELSPNLFSDVPEPASLCILGFGAIGLLTRRRRNA